jgi:predicted RNase H-like HicB family nuclease
MRLRLLARSAQAQSRLLLSSQRRRPGVQENCRAGHEPPVDAGVGQATDLLTLAAARGSGCTRDSSVPIDPVPSPTYDAKRPMTESIALEVHLQAFVRSDTTRRWIATCPMVGVVSQGKSDDDARRCLQEAVELWFESCVERGVLDQALREANFLPSPAHRSDVAPAAQMTRRRGARAKRTTSVLGEPFEIHLTIPAYEAATLLSATA